jgi:hypothetical protein
MSVTKQQLKQATSTAKAETTNALQLVYNALNQGQQKKLLKDETVKVLFDRYGVITE